MAYTFKIPEMVLDISRMIAEVGETVKWRRYAGGVYDSSKVYQSPTSDPSLQVDENIVVAWNVTTANQVVQYFGRIEPEDLTILATSDLKAGDIIIRDFGLSTQLAYRIDQARSMDIRATAVGAVAILKSIPRRAGG